MRGSSAGLSEPIGSYVADEEQDQVDQEQRVEWCKVGDVVVPADNALYRGVVAKIDENHVWHRCLATGMVQRKSRFGFACRYRILAESEGNST
jgi:hypothetical protein